MIEDIPHAPMEFLVSRMWRIVSERWSWRADRLQISRAGNEKWVVSGWCPTMDRAFTHIEEQMLRGSKAATKAEVLEAIADIRQLIAEARARAEMEEKE